jgi:Phosphoinositide-specific phospholipase C, efhand-like
VRLLKEREEVFKLFREYAGEDKVLSMSQFEEFLIREQNVLPVCGDF